MPLLSIEELAVDLIRIVQVLESDVQSVLGVLSALHEEVLAHADEEGREEGAVARKGAAAEGRPRSAAGRFQHAVDYDGAQFAPGELGD